MLVLLSFNNAQMKLDHLFAACVIDLETHIQVYIIPHKIAIGDGST
jgi:hypothetical protein